MEGSNQLNTPLLEATSGSATGTATDSGAQTGVLSAFAGSGDHHGPSETPACEKERMEVYSDALWGVVLTILAIPLRVEGEFEDETVTFDLLWDSKWFDILGYFYAFYFIWRQWQRHCLYLSLYAEIDTLVLVLNALWLMIVAFLPFSLNLVMKHWVSPSWIIFTCNSALSELVSLGLLYRLVLRKSLVDDGRGMGGKSAFDKFKKFSPQTLKQGVERLRQTRPLVPVNTAEYMSRAIQNEGKGLEWGEVGVLSLPPLVSIIGVVCVHFGNLLQTKYQTWWSVLLLCMGCGLFLGGTRLLDKIFKLEKTGISSRGQLTYVTRFNNWAMRKSRLEGIQDGIHAVIATLVVLDIRVPSPDAELTAKELWEKMDDIWPEAVCYVLCFGFITASWVQCHMIFSYCTWPSTLFMVQLMTMGSLMALGLVPMLTSILITLVRSANVAPSAFSDGVFALSLLIMGIGILHILTWSYLWVASAKKRASKPTGKHTFKYVTLYLIAMPLVSGVLAVVSKVVELTQTEMLVSLSVAMVGTCTYYLALNTLFWWVLARAERLASSS